MEGLARLRFFCPLLAKDWPHLRRRPAANVITSPAVPRSVASHGTFSPRKNYNLGELHQQAESEAFAAHCGCRFEPPALLKELVAGHRSFYTAADIVEAA